MKTIIKKMVTKKRKGQALLVVMIISMLTLMMLMGVASRINTARTNIRRSAEFDRAVASSESALNEIIRNVGSDADCEPEGAIGSDGQFKKIDSCAALNAYLQRLRDTGENVEVFGRVANSSVAVSVTNPVALAMRTSPPVNLNGIIAKCSDMTAPAANYRLIISAVYVTASGEYKIAKAFTTCERLNQTSTEPSVCTSAQNTGNVELKDTNGANIALPLTNAKMIRARLVDGGSNNPGDVQISLKAKQSASGNICETPAQTGNYEFIVAGLGGLGSDNAIKFQKPQGDRNEIPGAFDWVYFGEDL